ncbi:hypothetical protein CDL15_Pgr003758 [Punica granatum]|uniref:DC1 domain-containing protein n=1 Tax=Punica granatum TaxID=22663 RepID=A0A218XUL7_PUNGR|nr:hypothetical protein CDL15_Pgr003758 [Punica granatum]
MIYGCNICNFFLDNSCRDLPPNIFHPSHPDHRLTLRTSASSFRCSSCSKSGSGFSFGCLSGSGCDFSLDVHCAVPRPIRHKFHLHPLSFFNEWKGRSLSCDFCRKPCESLVLYCLECQFGIHLLCGPLPSTIHFEDCHEDRLTLTLSLEVDEDDSDDEECFYCDVCEKEVELHTPAYTCKGCYTLAHITCVIDEVLTSLKREHTVPLISIDGKAEQDGQSAEKAAKMKTLQGIMNDFNDSEKKDLDKLFKRRVAEIVRAWAFRKTSACSRIQSPFSDQVFVKFMDRLHNLNIHHTDPSALDEEGEELVAVGEYKVTRKLAPVLEDLFAKYGDVSAKGILSSDSKVKTYVFVILCWTINSMLHTKVSEISEGLLYRWWSYLIFVHYSAFEITFGIDRLKEVIRAHYSLRDESNTITKLDREIADLTDEIHELKQKLDKREKRLRARNLVRITYGRPTDESLKEAYASKALAWKWQI